MSDNATWHCDHCGPLDPDLDIDNKYGTCLLCGSQGIWEDAGDE